MPMDLRSSSCAITEIHIMDDETNILLRRIRVGPGRGQVRLERSNEIGENWSGMDNWSCFQAVPVIRLEL